VSLAAVQLAKQIFGRLTGRTVLLLGAGENSEQTARLLLKDGAAPRILVSNRTEERARALAGRIGGGTVPFEQAPAALAQADIVICSTGAPHPIVGREQVQAAMRARRGRPIFLIDIAVPRDVAPEVGHLDDVFLYNIDDLQAVVQRSLEVRRSEAEKVEAIVEEEVLRFQGWLRARAIGPTIAELKEHAETIVQGELERAAGKLGALPEPDRQAVEALVRRVTRRLLHFPIVHLRDAAQSGNGYHEVNAVRSIFRLGTGAGGGDGPDRPDRTPAEPGADLVEPRSLGPEP
jgi:glutamyl-tRNA reductase